MRGAEQAIAQMLGIRAQLAISDVPAPLESLTQGELAESREVRPRTSSPRLAARTRRPQSPPRPWV